MAQQGDVDLYQTPDDGEIDVTAGVVGMSGGLGTAAYLSLFGGNEDDPGGSDVSGQWWGNYLETDPARKYRSQTQHLLQSLPATSGNLLRVEDAATNDLQWFVDVGAATKITVSASIPVVNTLALEVLIETEATSLNFNFSQNWSAQ